MFVLSICIPTYNRKDCLRQCLDSIIVQKNFSEIEIVISDNASNDGTEEMMQDYMLRYPNILYTRNEENLGFDRNMLNVVSLAHGKYCCFIGDDDAFFPESISHIVDIVRKGDAQYYITNNWGYDISLSAPVTLRPNLLLTEDKRYQTLQEFVYSLQPDRIKTVGFFGGMSGQVFLREKWDTFVGKEKFIGSQTIHLFVLMNVMKDSTFILIANPTIKTRADNIRWDTFYMKSAWKREMMTLDTFFYIAKLYDIPYNIILLYLRFIWNYIKNMTIFYIKKYLLTDQKTIVKIKKLISKFIPIS